MEVWYLIISGCIVYLSICESPSIDKDAMALKVYHNILIVLFNLIKYTCQRETNCKTMTICRLSVDLSNYLVTEICEYVGTF